MSSRRIWRAGYRGRRPDAGFDAIDCPKCPAARAGERVEDRDQDVLGAAPFDLVHHAQPESGNLAPSGPESSCGSDSFFLSGEMRSHTIDQSEAVVVLSGASKEQFATVTRRPQMTIQHRLRSHCANTEVCRPPAPMGPGGRRSFQRRNRTAATSLSSVHTDTRACLKRCWAEQRATSCATRKYLSFSHANEVSGMSCAVARCSTRG